MEITPLNTALGKIITRFQKKRPIHQVLLLYGAGLLLIPLLAQLPWHAVAMAYGRVFLQMAYSSRKGYESGDYYAEVDQISDEAGVHSKGVLPVKVVDNRVVKLVFPDDSSLELAPWLGGELDSKGQGECHSTNGTNYMITLCGTEGHNLFITADKFSSERRIQAIINDQRASANRQQSEAYEQERLQDAGRAQHEHEVERGDYAF